MALIIFLSLTLVGRIHELELLNNMGHSFIVIYMMIILGLESGNIIDASLVRKNYIYQELLMANNALDAKYQFSRNRL